MSLHIKQHKSSKMWAEHMSTCVLCQPGGETSLRFSRGSQTLSPVIHSWQSCAWRCQSLNRPAYWVCMPTKYTQLLRLAGKYFHCWSSWPVRQKRAASGWAAAFKRQELKQTISDRGWKEVMHKSPLLEKEAIFKIVNGPKPFESSPWIKI